MSLLNRLILDSLVESILKEDLGRGDLTTAFLQSAYRAKHAEALMSVRNETCVISGLEAASIAFLKLDSQLVVKPLVSCGDVVEPGTGILKISGSIRNILMAERTALNLLQHLSGIATHTRRFVEVLAGSKVKLTHTRKTTPLLRMLERQAVLDGGGSLHRMDLGDAVMIKDNHLAALGIRVVEAVALIREKMPHTAKIEIEADSLQGVMHALDAKADCILLDNMTPEMAKEAIKLIQGRAIVEISGGITLDTIEAYAATGPDVISTSQITLGAPSVDIGLDLTLAEE
jgi:nicotinate-nucleotide pyrophosphorylase (carboxylating)